MTSSHSCCLSLRGGTFHVVAIAVAIVELCSLARVLPLIMTPLSTYCSRLTSPQAIDTLRSPDRLDAILFSTNGSFPRNRGNAVISGCSTSRW
ncbi:hypothetical protein BDN67DRAFT_972527 [Paxillus ammoniavirescens]|nr:hypothetical protein BDN67DRAFT_972527 [Paxillus ammoniavirescens]